MPCAWCPIRDALTVHCSPHWDINLYSIYINLYINLYSIYIQSSKKPKQNKQTKPKQTKKHTKKQKTGAVLQSWDQLITEIAPKFLSSRVPQTCLGPTPCISPTCLQHHLGHHYLAHGKNMSWTLFIFEQYRVLLCTRARTHGLYCIYLV